MRNLVFATILLLGYGSAWAQNSSEDWIDSPEASFATSKEREEWFRLTSDPQRDAFINRYWQKRDPTPPTEKNEFKDVILDRIRKADAKFTISGGAVGSRTAQGQVYIVLGPAARARTEMQSPAQRPPAPGAPPVRAGPYDPGTQTITWTYDRFRTPHLLEMLGRPDLSLTIVVEPNRRIDTLQNPGLFEHYRAVLAEKSISNPSAQVPMATPTPEIAVARLNAPLRDSVEEILNQAKPASARSASGVVFSIAELWMPKSAAVVSIAIPDARHRPGHLTTYGEIRSAGKVVGTIAEPFTSTDAVAVADGASAATLRMDLPPGTYDMRFALIDDGTNEALLDIATPLKVSDPGAPFAVSSLLLAGEPRPGIRSAFTFGKVSVQPRADLQFKASESLWYFLTLRATSGDGITADVVLRRSGKPLASNTSTPQMEALAPGIYLVGQELPLASFTPGDYTLYVVVHSPSWPSEVRRSDFRVVAR